MENIDYSTLSLKSLKTLKMIYELGSITAAAMALRQNQPTVSYTLEQMRTVFTDPLFVRSGRGVSPTARCHEIMPTIDELLRRMAGLLQPNEFVPSEADLDVSISCNLYELQVLMPAVVARLRELAPNLHILFSQSNVNGHKQLQQGLCDLLLSPMDYDYESLYKKTLLNERYVCLVPEKHVLAGKTITKNEYLEAKHIEIIYEGGWTPLYLMLPELQGAELNVALRLPCAANFIPDMAGDDLLVTLPERLARLIGGSMLIQECPFDCRFTLNLYWNKLTHHSQAHQWLRQNIVALCTQDLSA